MVEPLRFARIFQILRVILVLRSSKRVFRELFRNRKETTFASIILLLVILLTIGAGTILLLEHKDPNANITTGHDALWWAFVTISTVGYGDHYPVTTSGQLVASMVIICGVGVFGMISGLITSLITSPTDLQNQQRESKERKLDKILEQQQLILERLDALEKQTKNRASPIFKFILILILVLRLVLPVWLNFYTDLARLLHRMQDRYLLTSQPTL